MERTFKRALKGKLSKVVRAEVKKALEDIGVEREKQKTDPRVAAPVGAVTGGSESRIEIDHHRGSVFTSFRDRPRAIYSGNSLLQTMESWKAVVTVLSAEPFGGAIPADWKPEPVPAAVVERIKGLEQVLSLPSGDQAGMVEKLSLLWQVCEYFGALVEFELDYETTE